jgi:hypothetical protein
MISSNHDRLLLDVRKKATFGQVPALTLLLMAN